MSVWVITSSTGLPMYCDYCSRPIQPYNYVVTYVAVGTMKFHVDCWYRYRARYISDP